MKAESQQQQRVQRRALPTSSSESVTVLGGPSPGRTCDFCGDAIAPEAAEIEVSWFTAGERATAYLHPSCHNVWTGGSTGA